MSRQDFLLFNTIQSKTPALNKSLIGKWRVQVGQVIASTHMLGHLTATQIV